jgi:hypothetical protein
MAADWYYIEEGKSVGPVSTEEIIGRIRKAKDQPLFVWTAGMSEWTDAHTIPQFSAGFQMEEPAQPHPEKGYVEAQQPATGGHATLATARAARGHRLPRDFRLSVGLVQRRDVLQGDHTGQHRDRVRAIRARGCKGAYPRKIHSVFSALYRERMGTFLDDPSSPASIVFGPAFRALGIGWGCSSNSSLEGQ